MVRGDPRRGAARVVSTLYLTVLNPAGDSKAGGYFGNRDIGSFEQRFWKLSCVLFGRYFARPCQEFGMPELASFSESLRQSALQRLDDHVLTDEP